MNKFIMSLLVSIIVFFPIPFTSAQTTDTAGSASAQKTTSPQLESTKEKDKDKKAADSTQTMTPTTMTAPTWESEVMFPLVRLLGIAVILGLLLWWIDLPELMKGETWTDRTVIALIIIFSFAAASLINISDKALSALKDVTLIVVGFYFGAAKTSGAGGGSGGQGGGQQGQAKQGQQGQ